MATELMTFERTKNRWRKMHNGETYTISCKRLGTPKDRTASRAAANEWWINKEKEINGTPASRTIERFVTTQPASVLAKLAVGESKTLDTFLEGYRAEDQDRWDRFTTQVEDTLDRLIGNTPTPKTPAKPSTIREAVKKWQAIQIASKKHPARAKMNCHLCHFIGEYGCDKTVQDIGEDFWEGYWNWIAAQTTWGEDYKRRVLGTGRTFINYLWEKRTIADLPRNLESSVLKFKGHPKPIKTVEAKNIAKWYAHAKGQTRLHCLLALNCGFIPSDCSTLLQSEVDWENGTITRKRGKTKDCEDVPTVTYKLWESTFTLLKEYRSSHPEFVLLTKTGKQWVVSKYDGDKYTNSNSIGTNYKRTSTEAGVKFSPKQLRTTAANMLGKHPQYKFYHDYFLGHSPRTVSEKHYLQPSDQEFFEALAWLEKQFAL